MLQRVDAMESELGALVESLRTGANRLTADLTLLQGNMGDLRGRRHAGPRPAPAAGDRAGSTTTSPTRRAGSSRRGAEAPSTSPSPRPRRAPPAAGGGDTEGARLIALNMALNGTPRDETDRYLAENFDLDDRERLLDEVYSRVG